MAIHPSAIIEPGAVLGEGTSVGAFSIIHSGVTIGDNSRIDSHCLVGHAEPGNESLRLEIGTNARIRSHSVIYAGSTFGSDLQTGHSVTIREGATIGQNLRIGTLSDVEGHCTIGDFVRFHSNVHIGQKSRIGNYVWIFPFVVLTNDPHPPSNVMEGVVVEDFAAISTMSVVIPGVTIGKDSLVGAGAVVTSDVRSGAIAAGVPAKDFGDAAKIELKDGGGSAYPWRRHFQAGYPDELAQRWLAEFDDDRS